MLSSYGESLILIPQVWHFAARHATILGKLNNGLGEISQSGSGTTSHALTELSFSIIA